MFKHLLIAIILGLLMPGDAVAQEGQSGARIGILAYRGSDQLQRKWLALRDYLGQEVPEWSFEIIPVTLSSAAGQIEAGQLDFIVTNPGHFVDLNRRFRLSVLATRLQKKSNGAYSAQFGSAIIASRASGLQQLADAAGKSVSAIDMDAFGGFQIAWQEFERAGIDLLDDPSNLRFVGFPMDQVVMLVRDGTVDVGIVRSGLMEDLAREGRIDPADFVHLNENVTYGHPDKVSTVLYPEWPFAVLATTDPNLSNRVALALLRTSEAPIDESEGAVDRWSAPVAYHSVRELKDAFDAKTTLATTKSERHTHYPFWGFGVLMVFAVAAMWHFKRAKAGTAVTRETSLEKMGVSKLTRREREVLSLVANGYSTKEIAIELGISPKTVEFHRSNLLRKFDAKTSSQLIALAT